VVYQGLSCDNIIFEGRVESAKPLNLLYDDVERHYRVITNLTGAMARRYICKACNKSCWRDVSHVCDKTCSDCMMNPPCTFEDIRIPCEICNRHFRSQKCFDNQKRRTPKKRTVCDRKRCWGTCGALVTRENHECNKRYCQNCNQNKEACHLCFMRPLKNVLPAGDRVLYVFYDFETTQNTRYSETATLNIPNLLCLQQYCSKCEDVEDVERDCV